jgi:hypothetical protein
MEDQNKFVENQALRKRTKNAATFCMPKKLKILLELLILLLMVSLEHMLV